MFDRAKYKKFARMQLQKRWTVPVLITLIICTLLMIFQAKDFKELYSIMSVPEIEGSDNAFNFSIEFFEPTTTAFSSLMDWVAILIQFIIMYAQVTVYLKMSRGPEPIKFSDFIEGFASWARAILAGLWQFLWIFLWSLLFIIPGIVKAYSYSQMFYLLAEFPELSVTKSMRISKEITRGHKGDLFVMHLSFIGWAILATIPAGIGWLWLHPYINMSMTNAYHALLKDAISFGVITQYDLKG